MNIEAFFDKATFTLTYVVWDPDTRDAGIVDPVMDYDPGSSTCSFESLEKVEAFVRQHELNVRLILETHAHADHLSSSQELKKRFPGAKLAIGEEITAVQRTFKEIFNLDHAFATDGSQFDQLIRDGERFQAGSLEFEAIHTPGHTPACYSYRVGNAVFTGDALFMPDFGVGRCDFPKGSARDLYHSVQKLYALPEETRVFTGHDYQPGGRELRYESTIGEEKRQNIQLKAETTEEEFVRMRTERDKTLSAPRLLLPSIQVNADGGRLPPAEGNGVSYLKIPVRLKNG